MLLQHAGFYNCTAGRHHLAAANGEGREETFSQSVYVYVKGETSERESCTKDLAPG